MQQFIRFIVQRSTRQVVWKTLNGVVGIVTVLNLSFAGTFLAGPTAAQAQIPTGTLTVHKLADANGDGTFESVDPASFKWFLMSDPGAHYDMGASRIIPVGGVIVSETGPAGYQFTGWSFGGPDQATCAFPVIPLPEPFVVVPVTMDQETVITLCNVHDTGLITVNKNFDDNGDGVVDRTNPQGWTWDIAGGSQDNVGGQTVMVPTGSVTVQEDPITGYSATWVCSDESSSSGTSHTVTVAQEPTVSCTVTNTRDTGTLTVNKNFDDNGDGVIDRTNPQGWTWDIAGGSQDNVGGSTLKLFTDAYRVTEEAIANYSSSWSCSDQSSGTGTGLSAQVTKSDGEIPGLTCTFTNARDTGTLVVNKQYDDNSDGVVDRTNPQGWTWDVAGGSQDNAGGAGLGLVTGTYTISENAEANYITTWSCSDQTNGSGTTLNASVAKGQTLTCSFANTKKLTTIAMDKQGVATVSAGNNLTYTLAWSVNGNTAATTAVVTDALPANTTFVSAGCGTTTGTCTIDSSTGTIAWNLGTRNPGESGNVTLTVKSNSPLTNGTVITNTGVLDTDQTNPVSDSVSTTVQSAPTLGLTKQADPTTVNPLTNVTYTISWSVGGNANATNVVITDPVPTNVTFVSAADGGAYDAATKTITWNLGTKAPGSNGQVTWVGQIATDASAGQIVNTAAIDSTETDPPVTAAATVTVVIPQVLGAATQPDLSITKSVNQSTAKPGDVVTYTLTVKSTGTEDAHTVVVADTLPKDLSFVDFASRTATWNLGTINVGDSRTITVDVRVESDAKPGDHLNVATAVADGVEQKKATATLTVKTPRVLGLATTGVGMLDYMIALAGAGLLGLGLIGLRRRSPPIQLMLPW